MKKEVDFVVDKKFKYLEKGEGTILLLLHGLFGALGNFVHVIDHFSKKYKISIPLLPIYELPILESTVNGLVKFVHKYIEYKNYKSVVLVGNSLGGHIALLYALKYPAKVKAVVLTGSSGLFESNGLGEGFPQRGNYEYIKERAAYTFYDPKTATKELVDEVFDAVNNRNKVLRIISTAKSAMKNNLAKALPKIKAPTFLIWGKDDKITPPYVGEEFKKLIPNAELQFIDKCGHAPMMETPEKFNSFLEDFLQRHFPQE